MIRKEVKLKGQILQTKIGSTVFVRATASIVKDNRLFVIEDEDGYTIGVKVFVNETTEDAVVVKEELGVTSTQVR